VDYTLANRFYESQLLDHGTFHFPDGLRHEVCSGAAAEHQTHSWEEHAPEASSVGPPRRLAGGGTFDSFDPNGMAHGPARDWFNVRD
jgi:hypothetical protein